VRSTVLLNSALRGEFEASDNISFVAEAASGSVLGRWIHEQTGILRFVRRSGAHVLISAGNFALLNSPIPQILLSRNSLYTSSDFIRDVRTRGDYAIWIDTSLKGWLARQSIRSADVTVAPSQAFAGELSRWSGREVAAIHHGFDTAAFTNTATPLSAEIQAQLDAGRDALRLLFVSHYNYYRNFETLFRAMPILSRRLQGKKVRLYLTCRLNPGENPGSYRTQAASALLDGLRTSCDIVELGSVPYHSLHRLYRACDIYVTPAYAESFAHPLVEAMSSGVPVVASDLPVHREICADAAVYFLRFSPEELAECVARVCSSAELRASLANNGRRRSHDFSWEKHVSRVIELAGGLLRAQSNRCD